MRDHDWNSAPVEDHCRGLDVLIECLGGVYEAARDILGGMKRHSDIQHDSVGAGTPAMAQTGTRHLEPSSATHHKRTDWAETVGCLQQTSVYCVGRRTTPSGTTPSRTSRHKAIKSLRAKATIMSLRVPRACSVRAPNHCAKALFL